MDSNPILQVFDVNGDGLDEVLMHGDAGTKIMFGTNGSVQSSYPSIKKSNSKVTCVDIEGDGMMELVIMMFNGTITCRDIFTGSISWKTTIPATSLFTTPLVLDIAGDGTPEMVFSNGWKMIYEINCTNGAISRQLNNSQYWEPVAAADVNRDGYIDIITIGGGYPNAICFSGLNFSQLWGISGLSKTSTFSKETINPVVADVDKDGNLEVLFSYNYNTIKCYSAGNGTLKWTAWLQGEQRSLDFVVADVDGDLVMEIGYLAYDCMYFISGTNGTLKIVEKIQAEVTTNILVYDLDGDGYLEILYSWYMCNRACSYTLICESTSGCSWTVPGPWPCFGGNFKRTHSFLDEDRDGLSSVHESAVGTNFSRSDTDGDGFSDGLEIGFGSNPLNNTDRPPFEIFDPPSCTTPPDMVVAQNETAVNVTWCLSTENPAGVFRVLRNGTEVITWQSWMDGMQIPVPVDTNIGVGTWVYRLEFSDNISAGALDDVLVHVNDIPWVSGGNDINGTVLAQNASAAFINWTIHDQCGSGGQYTVLVNGSTGIPWSSYVAGCSLAVPVDTNGGFGTFNYTLRYRDGFDFAGVESHVLVVIADRPRSNHPVDRVVLQNSTGTVIEWRITDTTGPGQYRVLLDGGVLSGWTPWVNDTSILVPVDADGGLGSFHYTIEFNNSRGIGGIPDAAVVVINDLPAIVTSPGSILVPQNASPCTVSWVLEDRLGPGTYNITINDVAYITCQPWSSGEPVTIAVDTNMGIASWNYSILYVDSHGMLGLAGSVLVTIDDTPVITSVESPGTLFQGTPGAAITWMLQDLSGGGSCSISRDGSLVVVNQTWACGVPVVVPVDTGIGFGTFNYTISFHDLHGFAGSQGVVLVTVNDMPSIVASPGPAMFQQNSTGNITWTILDHVSGGTYTIYVNGTVCIAGQPWVSNTPIIVPVDTNRGLGRWNYIIMFTDAHGIPGVPGSVLVVVDDTPRVMQVKFPDLLLEFTAGAPINWTIHDSSGNGSYSIFVNGVASIANQPWVSGMPVSINPSTTSGAGAFNYTIRYQDFHGHGGMQDVVIILVEDVPVVVNHPPSFIDVLQFSPEMHLSWTISDAIGTGTYTIRLNGFPLPCHDHAAWQNNTPLTVAVSPDRPGTYNFTIAFEDSSGFHGCECQTIVIVNGKPWIDGNAPADILSSVGTAGLQVTWCLVDNTCSNGFFTVLRDGIPVPGQVGVTWLNTTPFSIGVDRSRVMTTDLTLVYWNAKGIHGVEDHVTVRVNDHPIVLYKSNAPKFVQFSDNKTIFWVLDDATGPGNYTVFVNGVPLQGHISKRWNASEHVRVRVNTSVEATTWNYPPANITKYNQNRSMP